jgi:hypothetical protein
VKTNLCIDPCNNKKKCQKKFLTAKQITLLNKQLNR